jgi:hypothetical protein
VSPPAVPDLQNRIRFKTLVVCAPLSFLAGLESSSDVLPPKFFLGCCQYELFVIESRELILFILKTMIYVVIEMIVAVVMRERKLKRVLLMLQTDLSYSQSKVEYRWGSRDKPCRMIEARRKCSRMSIV